MKELFVECYMGVAGDMLCGALFELLQDEQKQFALDTINSFIEDVDVSVNQMIKCGISGTKFDVKIKEHGHHHTSISEIYDIINALNVNDAVKHNAIAVYTLIADAESIAHNMPVADVHLHEVGMKDAIVDIVSACYLMDLIGAKRIVATSITTGFGEVKTAHGIMPVPAPATANLLKSIPSRRGSIEGELCTPTGVALLKYFADEFVEDYSSKAVKIGYGMGTKDFEKPNCVRVMLSDVDDEIVYELKCQIDDMTGEEMGYAINKFMSLGALDAFAQPIIMKKSRPAFLLCVIANEENADDLTTQFFKHTTTLGVRKVKCTRSVLDREIVEINGVSVKRSSGYGLKKEKIEFDDLAKIADQKDISIFEARELLK